MADLPPYPDSDSDSDDDARVRPGRGAPTSIPPGTPRWVKVFGIIVIVLVLLIVIALATGLGGPHGPRRHTPSGGSGIEPVPALTYSNGGPDDLTPSGDSDDRAVTGLPTEPGGPGTGVQQP